MPNRDQLSALLVRWRELRAQGQTATPETLCADCPELLPVLRNQLEALASMEGFLAQGQTSLSAIRAEQEATTDATQFQAVAGAQRALQLSGHADGWPTLPGFDIQAELGRGGMGVVYKACDRLRQQVVALKTMQGLDPSRLYLFKQEFRSLADLSHPNLVNLHELVSDGTLWFFTMELVEGVNFLHFVRGPGTEEPTSLTSLRPPPTCAEVAVHLESGVTTAGEETVPRQGPALPAGQLERLRAALWQLAEGIHALHAAGKLHRDIKPSNVLVTAQARVVLLDFGLAANIDPLANFENPSRHIVGTIGYMAPEQAAGQPLSPASDWYSLGVMLYEALTGTLPFRGDPAQVLRAKQISDPPPPANLASGVPEDLNDLCLSLLRRPPEERPSGASILQQLQPQLAKSQVPARPVTNLSLLGRDSHLASLADAFATTRQGRPVTVLVPGPSGTGKSSLVHSFLRQLRDGHQAAILAGRCYEKEAVPYKALDSLIDALSRLLEALRPLEVEALLPPDIWTLSRVFPVLRQVKAIAQAKGRDRDITDPQESRRRATVALRKLMGKLGQRYPLVLYIDDLQWGDTDSAALLADLLRPPQAPVFLFIGCFRSENRTSSPFIQTLLQATGKNVDRREVPVEPLSPGEALELARSLLVQLHPGLASLAEGIANESGGNPLFLYELVQACRVEVVAPAPGKTVTLDKVLWQRIERLPTEARRLLEVLAVAGRPMPLEQVSSAAKMDGAERVALNLLRTGRLLRSSGAAQQNIIETYHDRIRETILTNLAPIILKEHHHSLATTLETTAGIDPEVLAGHWEGAQELHRAGNYYLQAAQKAAQTLAFEHAAHLYRRALELLPEEQSRQENVRRHLGEALANAGRGGEAGPVYLAAAAESTDQALELRRRAAEQLLLSGHIDQGLAIVDQLLAAMGMTQPRQTWQVLLWIMWLRLRQWWHGLKYREKPAQAIPAKELLWVDTCWSIALGLSHVNPVRGLLFQRRHLLTALQVGEPYRLARALGMEVATSAVAGGRNRQHTFRLWQQAQDLAQKVNQPHALGITYLGGGIAAFLEGRWRQARELCERSDRIFRDQCTGVAWELHAANFYGIRSLEFLGEIAEMIERLPAFLEDAQRRGDLFAETNLGTRVHYLLLLLDDRPAEARQALRAAIGQWSQQGFHLQHYFELMAEVEICHYGGDYQQAWDWVSRRWPALSRSFLLRVQTNLITMHHVHGRAAVALAAVTQPGTLQEELLQVAERDASIMEGEDMAWSNPQALLVRAAITWIRGRQLDALALLARAEIDFRAADMALYAAVTQRRRGQLLGGPEGQKLQEDADTWMTGQKIRNPARFTATYAPGFDHA